MRLRPTETGSVSAPSVPFTTKSLFLRKSTGLVRDLGAWDCFIMNQSNTGGFVNFAIYVLIGAAIFPGANLALATVTGALLGTGLMAVYAYMAGAMPRSGGDYIFTSRTINPGLGFVIGWAAAMQSVFWPAYGGWSMATWVIPDIIGPVGKAIGNTTLVTIANALPQRHWLLPVALVSVVLIFLLSLLGLRWAVRFQVISLIVTVVAFLVAVPWVLFGTSKDSFAQHFNTFAAQYGTSASKVLSLAHADGYKGPSPFSWTATMAFWPFILILTAGAMISIAMSGEVRKPGRSQMIGTVGGNLFGALLLAVMLLVVQARVNANLMGALGFFAFVDPAHNPFPYPLYGHVILGIMTGSQWITILTGIAVGLNLWITGTILMLYSTRFLFAFSFDRMFPSWAAKIDRNHAPRNALILVACCSLGFVFLLVFVPKLTIVGTGLLYVAQFIAVSICGIIIPWRLPEIYKSSIKKALGGVPIVTLVGIWSLAYIMLETYYYLTKGEYGATSSVSWQFAGGIFLSGIVAYAIARIANWRRGVDVGLTYREIPPE